jgi:hypothetical protein
MFVLTDYPLRKPSEGLLVNVRWIAQEAADAKERKTCGGFRFDFFDGGTVDGFGWSVREYDNFYVVVHGVLMVDIVDECC